MGHENSGRLIEKSWVLRRHILFTVEAVAMIYERPVLEKQNYNLLHLVQVCVEYR